SARHDPPAVEQNGDGLVALSAVGAHDRLAGPRGRGPVDATELVVGRVLAQRLELGAAAATLRTAQADLQQPGPVDAQLCFVLGSEWRVHPQQCGHLAAALAGDETEWALDAHDDLARHEPA